MFPEAETSEDQMARDIRHLSYAEHFIVWVMRTAIACAPECRMIHREFVHAFGPHVEAGARAFERVLLILAKGTRPITLARPGHIYLTNDEMSLVALFAAAQGGDSARCLAHARWMMGQSAPEPLGEAAAELAGLLARNSRTFRRMPDAIPPDSCRGAPVSLRAVN